MRKLLLIFVGATIILSGCMQVISSKDNNAPVAKFAMNYKSANTSTQFIFDGSFSSDDHESASELKYLWKYYSRFGKLVDSSFGVIDSSFFSDTGYYFINLTVFDADSLSGSCEDTIHVLKTLAPAINVIDTTIDFGPVEIEYSIARKLSISNAGSDTLKIKAVYFSGEQKNSFYSNFEESINILPDSTNILKINFLPIETGQHNSTINIVSNDEDFPEKKIAVKGEGFDDLYNIVIENLEQDTINFGNVKMGNDSTFKLVLKNIGSEPREILAAYIVGENKNAFDCDFSSEMEIKADETQTLAVEFSPLDTITQIAKLIIKSDDTFSESKEIFLTGKGYKNSPILKLLNVNNALLDFEGVGVERTSTIPLEIKNIGTETLSINAMFVAGDDKNYFDCDFQDEFSLDAGENTSIDISFSPVEKREYNGVLKIYSNDDNSSVYNLNLTGYGTQSVLEILNPANNQIEFGDVKVEQDSTISVTIKNSGDGELTVEDVYLMNENESAFRCNFQSEFSLTSGETNSIEVTFSPGEIMDYSAELVIKTDEIENNKQILTVSGTGFQNLTMSIDKDTLNYGNVYIGEDSVMTLDIQNNGAEEIQIFEMKFTGNYTDGFDIDSEEELTISPQSSASLNVTFSPFDANLLWNNVLHIYSNDPTTPHCEIRLLGQGVVPPELECPDSVDFGDVKLNSKNEQQVTIKNVGDARIIGMTLKINSGDFTYVLDTPLDLLPNASVQMTVTFSPTDDTGDKLARMTISSENYGKIKSVILKGTAVNP